jgi:O-antigen/teichoic acid export membrane protein
VTSETITPVASVTVARTQRLAAHLRAPLHRTGYALVASTLATSGLGFLYWAIAARKYDSAYVGVNSSLINTMMFLTNFASLNFTDVLNRFVPVSGQRTSRLVRTSYLIAIALGGASATVFAVGLALDLWGKSFESAVHGPAMGVLFVVSTMLWCVFVLQDAVLAGLRRASVVLTENSLYGIAKIVLLVALATVAPHDGIFLSWTAPLLAIVVVINVLLFARYVPEHVNDPDTLEEEIQRSHVTRFLIADYICAMLWTTTIWLMPILVLAIEGKSASAYAYIAWTICFTLYLVSRNMGVALTTEGVRDPSRLDELTRATLRSTARIIVPGAIVLFVGAPWFLRIFGEEYAQHATTLMRYVAISAIPALVPYTFVSLARVQQRLVAMVVVTAATTVPVLIVTPALVHAMGIEGAGLGWLVVQTIAAIVLLAGELRSPSRARHAVVATPEAVGVLPLSTSMMTSVATVIEPEEAERSSPPMPLLDEPELDETELDELELDELDDVDDLDDLDEVGHLEAPEAPFEPEEPDAPSTAAKPRRRWRPMASLPTVTAGAGLVLWIISLTQVDVNAIGKYGLLSALPITYYAAVAALLLGVAIAVHQRARLPVVLAHAVLFVLIVHATPAIVYGTLRYAWAFKHVGIVELLQRTHRYAPQTPVLPIYQSWPGFFAAATALTESSGLRSALSFASWGPAFFELLNIGALVFVFRGLTDDTRRIGLAVWFFLIANWVGQDYFAPQAFGFFLYLVVIGIVLRYFRRPESQRPWARPRSAVPDLALTERISGPERRAASIVLLVVIAAISSSHPLTPIVMCTALLGLLALRVLSAKWPVVAALVMTLAWMFTGARSYVLTQGSTITGQVGKLGSNVNSNISDVGRLSQAQQLVADMGRLVVVALAVLAVVGFLRRVLSGHWDLEVAFLCAAPASIFFGGSYGGEAVFRVFLFALPFGAFLAAGAFYATPASRSRWWKSIAIVVVSCVLVAGFGFGYFGKELWFRFAPGEVRAAELVFGNAPPNSLLVEGTQTFPTGFEHQEYFTYVSIADEPPVSQNSVVRDPASTLYNWMSDPKYDQAYLIITRSMIAESDDTGLMAKGSLQRIERALLASDRFDVLYHDDDAIVLTVPRAATTEAG